jgi:hypothetical protein
MSLELIVKHFNTRDLDGDEIETLTGKLPVLYSELGKYKTLDELLGKENHAIVLYETSSKGFGHFVAITRDDDTGKVRYADSYGIPNPDTELQFTAYDKPLPKYLNKLLEPYDYESNTYPYQGKRKGVSTCGRWSSLFCRFRNLSLRQIQEMFTMNKSEFLSDTDNAATLLTLFPLRDITAYLGSLPRGGR